MSGDRTAHQERLAQVVGAIAGVVIVAALVLMLITLHGQPPP